MCEIQLEPIHGIYLFGIQRDESTCGIRYTDGFHLVKVGAAFFPIVGVALGKCSIARFPLL